MSVQERVEVSIFKDDVPGKTIISSIMNPRVRNGLGEILFDLLRDLTRETQHMSYNGPCYFFDRENSTGGNQIYLWKDLNVSIESCLYLFGGSVYQIHAANDNSRYQHILPGVHDIDTLGIFVVHHIDNDILIDITDPFIGETIDSSLELGGDILNQKGLFSFCLSEMTRIIKNKLVSIKPKKFYYRHTSDSSVPDEVEIINAIFTNNDDDILHQEIINNIFIYKIVNEGHLFKLQIEVTAKMGNIIETDHVFELVIEKGNQYMGNICKKLQNIGGIFLESKEELYIKNMKSMSSRAYMAETLKEDGDDENSEFSVGKCALDVLRICYLILTDLDNVEPWVTTPTLFRILSDFGDDNTYFNKKVTPIELFIIFLRYVSPCVERSGIKKFNLEKSPGLEKQSIHMAEILEIFSEFSGSELEKESKLFGTAIYDRIKNGKDIFTDRNARSNVNIFHRTLQNKKTRKLMMNDFDLTTIMYLKDYITPESNYEEFSALIQNRRNGLYVTINDHTYTVKNTNVSYKNIEMKLSTNLIGVVLHKKLNTDIEESIEKGEPLRKVGNIKQKILGYLFGGGEEVKYVDE